MISTGKTSRRRPDDYAALFHNFPNAAARLRVCTNKKGEAMDFLVLDVNRQWVNNLGLRRKECIGRKTTAIFPGFGSEWFRLAEEVGRTGKAKEFEYRAKRNGRWYQVSIFAYSPDECVLIFSDITESRNARECLRESEEALRSMINAVMGPAMLIDTKGTIIASNTAAAHILGAAPQEIAGANFFDRLPADVAQRRKREVRQVTTTRRPLVYEDQRDGRFYTISLHPMVDAGGSVTRIAAVTFDITENRLAQKRIEEKEERFRTLLECSSDIIQIVDSEGRFSYVSPSVEAILGYKPEELVGKPSVSVVHPEDLPEVAKGFEQAYAVPGKPVLTLCRCRHKDGTWRVLSGTGVNHLDNPLIRGFVANIRDVTEMRQGEKEREEQNRMLQEKNTALREVMAQLEQEKKRVAEQIQANIERHVLPVAARIKTANPQSVREYAAMLEENLREVMAPFAPEISSRMHKMTPKEIELCNMIKRGMSCKEIAQLTNTSHRTVETHRNRIRRKLGITDPAVNLSTYLKSV